MLVELYVGSKRTLFGMAENRTKLEWRNWQWWATLLLAAFIGAALVKAPAATWGLLVWAWKKVLLVSSLGI